MKIRQQLCKDGVYHYCDEAIIHSTNRGFRYGDAVFESMFVSSKKVPLLHKHFARIQEAAKYFEIKLKDDFTEQNIAKQIERLCNKNRLFQGARARLTVFRAEGGLYTPEHNDASYILEVVYYNTETYTLNNRGWNLGVYRDELKYPLKSGCFKTAQSLLYVKAGLYKKRNNYDEVILLSHQNTLVETIAHNIFLQEGKLLLTPSLSSGCVSGIMRETLIELAPRCGYIVEEIDSISIEMLEKAEGVFLTNAIVGIRWVGAWEKMRYFKNVGQELTVILNKNIFG